MLALVTCAAARDLDTDLPLLLAEMPDAEVVAWDDPTVDWSTFDAVVIRSAWDYHTRREAFLRWASDVERVCPLWNPRSLLIWNTDKRYLGRMASSGVPIVPTTFVEPGETLDPAYGLDRDLVIKPSIGAGSIDVVRTHGAAHVAVEHLASLHDRGLTAMVQPYLEQVDTSGETGLVYLGGEFSHAFVKEAILTSTVEYEGDLMAVETSEPRLAAGAELALGRQVIAILPDTAYARIDLLPSADGPVLLEIELTEPSLFLQHDPDAAARAAAVFRSLAR